MIVIAHQRISVDATNKNIADFKNAALNPPPAVFKAALQVIVEAAQPSTRNTAVDAVITGGVRAFD